MSKERSKKKLSIQKIFNLISFMFLLACVIFYGGRFIKLYIENNKVEETNSMAKDIKESNNENENFKNINGEYYFNGKDVNNYVSYSNLIWRIIKINTDNSITMTLDNNITSLAEGEPKNYYSSYINKWLNKVDNEEYSGILEKNLNNMNKYLTFTKTCKDTINDTKSISCKEVTEDTYITVPSLNDYVNTGGSNSFMNNEEYYYLINNNKENKVWYIDSDGKLGKSDGTDILGIKPVITIKGTIEKTGGNGSKDEPYTFEDETSLFGSYVKLNNDIWRIYEVNTDTVKLSLNDYLTINGEEQKYNYSSSGYYHNDTKSKTLAYYLKNTYLNKLSYKDLIKETTYANGLYSNTTNFDYTELLSTTVDTKVSILSVGDPILNSKLTNYFMSTGIDKNSNNVYVFQNDFKLYTKSSSTSLKIVPVISIDKNKLTKGTGTIDNPFEVE